MLKKPLLWETFFAVVLMAVLNEVAIRYYLYWKVNEFDSVVHFLAGVSVVFFVLYVFFHTNFFKPEKRTVKDFVLISVFAILSIGLIWEIFELASGQTSLAENNYGYDTTIDLLMDLLGGLAACFYACLREIKVFSSYQVEAIKTQISEKNE